VIRWGFIEVLSTLSGAPAVELYRGLMTSLMTPVSRVRSGEARVRGDDIATHFGAPHAGAGDDEQVGMRPVLALVRVRGNERLQRVLGSVPLLLAFTHQPLDLLIRQPALAGVRTAEIDALDLMRRIGGRADHDLQVAESGAPVRRDLVGLDEQRRGHP